MAVTNNLTQEAERRVYKTNYHHLLGCGSRNQFPKPRMAAQLRCLMWLTLFSSSMAHAANMSFAPGSQGKQDTITIQGNFVEGDDHKFRRLALQSRNAIVYLDSNGGRLDPALEIGNMIRLRGYATAVQDANCTSACAMVWLAGQPRVMNNFTSIGFHVPFVTEKNGKRVSTPLDGAVAGAYLTSLGFSKHVVTYVVTASADETHWLNAITARKLGIAMTFITPDQEYQARADFTAALDAQLKPQSDPNAVAKLYRSSAQMGFAGAQNNLGDKYETGNGVPKNPVMALYWYTRSAERGEPTAYLSLASMLSESSQDPETLVEAAKFAELARTNLPPGKNKNQAEGLVTSITQKLSEADRYRVLILVKRWMPLYQEDYVMGDTTH